MKKVKLGVLISGRGSNMQAIMDSIEKGKLSAEIKIVISDVKDAYGLERAGKHGIKTLWVDRKKYFSREDFDRAITAVLREHGVELIILAGYMRVLSPYFIKEFRMRIMNIHPALLPSFPGLHVQKKAVDYGVKYSGCTVHFVDEGTDTGPVILQAVVPVLDSDTEDTLSERILVEEHKIYSKAIQLYAEGKLEIKGRRVFVKK